MKMKKSHLISILFVFFISFVCNAQILEPAKWNFSMSEPKDGVAEIVFDVAIDDGWHVYGMNLPPDGPVATKFVFETVQNAELLGDVECGSVLVKKKEPTYNNMELEWYEKSAKFTQKVNVKDGYYVSGYVEYMACDDNACLPPAKEKFSFGVMTDAANEIDGEEETDSAVSAASPFAPLEFNDLSAENKENEEVDYWKPVEGVDGTCKDGDCGDDSVWNVFVAGLIGGFIAIITPCVWPIIPMTVSFFLKRGKNPRKGRKAAIVYGLSIVLIYVVLGLVITLLFKANTLNDLSTNEVFNVFLFALLTLFAMSFFGGFDLALPATWSTKIDNKADKTAGIFSILLMAFTLVIVSFSCTGPIIGTLLVQVHESGGESLFAPAIGMFGFALALAIPFTLFAFFPSWLHNLPRSGGWLNSVKVLLGFFELAFALKFLSVADLAYHWHILDREVFIALWIVIFSLMGFYLLGKLRFRGDDPVEEISVFRIFMAIGVFSFVVYLVPGLFGAPLKAISAFVPPMSTQDLVLYNKQVHALFDDYDLAMEYAKKNKKPVVVDFTGYGCVNCRKMESTVWTDPEVSSLLTSDYVLVSLYCDDKSALDEPFVATENGTKVEFATVGEKWSYLQRSKFGSNALPYYVLLDNKGDLLNQSMTFKEGDGAAAEFAEFLKKGLENYKNR
jgi:thiol:disulfide interchange protein DsbD